jgi:hypothetical protein
MKAMTPSPRRDQQNAEVNYKQLKKYFLFKANDSKSTIKLVPFYVISQVLKEKRRGGGGGGRRG